MSQWHAARKGNTASVGKKCKTLKYAQNYAQCETTELPKKILLICLKQVNLPKGLIIRTKKKNTVMYKSS